MLRPTLLALVALTACSGKPPTMDAGVDAGPTCLPADAGPRDAGAGDGGDFSCLGQPPPTVAVNELSISGFVTSAGLMRKPVPGALIELFDAQGALLASTTSSDDDAGTYALSTTIACAPLAGSMRASKPDAGYFDAWYYPPAPWRWNRKDLELVVFDAAAQNLVTFLAGVTVQSGTGALALGVEDCANSPVSGARVTSMPMGDVRYVADNGIPTSMGMATSSKGQLLIFNLPPGDVQLTATVGSTTLPTKTVRVRDGAITAMTLTP